ncbi:hypothetical protein GALMADRAFT_252278 [Galerina marginata CBS 339.88]|uniref:EamA domain-containing protein n=1 Tax=Galerina marginata (strain CBS 339.88) TaxID=685588 RepID=A0A067SZ42_GALM3|nr:hypothetical protein GALMADRAFT_252278 [Galerina marginata CBS 339.88]
MSSRNAYTALTPEYAEFAILHTPTAGPSNSSYETSTVPPRFEHAIGSDEDFEPDEGVERVSTVHVLREKIVEFFRSNTGLLLVAGAQAFLSFMNVAVKILNGIDPPVPTLELVAVRMLITYICCMAYMLSMGIPDPFLGPKGVRLLLVTRGGVGFFGLFGVYYSLQYLSLSDATVLTFLAPMCTAMAGSVLLGENFTRREAFAGIVSLVGVVLIARPAAIFGSPTHVPSADGINELVPAPMSGAEKGTPRDRLIAVGVALVGVLGATGAYTSIRAIGKRAHPLHSMSFFSVLCVAISSIGMIANKTPVIIPTRWDWLLLLFLIGIFGFVAQTLLTMGLQRETAGRGSMAVYTQIVFATILERIFFHAVPTVLSVIGTLLIVSSALYVALTKEKEGPAKPKSKSIHLQRLAVEAELEEGLLNSSDEQPVEKATDREKDNGHVPLEEERLSY